MASFLSLLSPAQLAAVNERAEITEKQASSATGQIVAGDDLGEFYLDDVNALFKTNLIDAGDIVEITAGTSPLGEYSAAGQFFDPAVPAEDQVAFEDRLIVDGFPTIGGPVTYRVLAPTPILEELASITQSKAEIQNVINPELQTQDDLYLVFLDKFDVVNDLVADVYKALKGLDRTRITTVLLNNSALGTVFTELFPQAYFGLQPNRTGIFGPPAFPIDVFNIAAANSEQEGKNDEVTAEPPSSGGPLLAAYLAALAKEDTALDAQDAALAALQVEITDNDQVTESGDLNVFYTAMSATIAAQRASIVLRKADIAAIILADDTRPNVGGLNFGSFGALQTEIDLRAAELVSAPFQKFLDLRFPYLDLIINRGFGTRPQLVSNTQQLTLNAERRQTLIDERETDRDLLQLP